MAADIPADTPRTAADAADVGLLPPAPPEVSAVFGAATGLAKRYAELLATDGIDHGLIGPREVPRLWDRHLLNCAVVAELVPEHGELVDIGSGAGLPGVVLAMLRPSLHVVLLEPLLRRSEFLAECVAALGLANATVLRARAEDKAAAGLKADMATARAVAPLDRLAGWAAGVLRPGGELLAIKGESAEAELEAARPVLSRLGVRSAGVLHVGHDKVVATTTVVRVVMGAHGREERSGAQRSRRGVA